MLRCNSFREIFKLINVLSCSSSFSNCPDDIDLALARRVKKINLEVPAVPKRSTATSMRIIKLVDLEYERLYDEVKGKPADPTTNQPFVLPARPELEIFTVGVVQCTQTVEEREEDEGLLEKEIIVESKVCDPSG